MADKENKGCKGEVSSLLTTDSGKGPIKNPILATVKSINDVSETNDYLLDKPSRNVVHFLADTLSEIIKTNIVPATKLFLDMEGACEDYDSAILDQEERDGHLLNNRIERQPLSDKKAGKKLNILTQKDSKLKYWIIAITFFCCLGYAGAQQNECTRETKKWPPSFYCKEPCNFTKMSIHEEHSHSRIEAIDVCEVDHASTGRVICRGLISGTYHMIYFGSSPICNIIKVLPDLTVTRQKYIPRHGHRDSVILTCEAQGLRSPSLDSKLRWSKEGVEINNKTEGMYVEKVGPHTLNLHVMEKETADSVMYTCQGELEGSDVEKMMPLCINEGEGQTTEQPRCSTSGNDQTGTKCSNNNYTMYVVICAFLVFIFFAIIVGICFHGLNVLGYLDKYKRVTPKVEDDDGGTDDNQTAAEVDNQTSGTDEIELADNVQVNLLQDRELNINNRNHGPIRTPVEN